MNQRERLNATLSHIEPDRVCFDLGAGAQTGIGVSALYRLRMSILGRNDRIKVVEPYQMLGLIDEDLRQALQLDVVGIPTPKTIFGFANQGWKPFDLFDGTPLLVPEQFNVTLDSNGNYLMYPEGDLSAAPSGKMPKDGYFFDAITRQQPLQEMLDVSDNCSEFALLSAADLEYYKKMVDDYYHNTPYGIYMTISGAAFGDIALVPAPWMKNPAGIRDIEEWYMSTVTRKDFIYKVFEYQCSIALKNIEMLAEAVGNKVQAVFVSGTDFGTQNGLFCSPKAYRELYKPFQKKVNDLIHKRTSWKVFIHSCGAIFDLIPDLIEAGFDILNPVQCSAAGMNPHVLKKEFGKDLVFWGGGIDTQNTLPFGTPEEVYRQAMERIQIFAPSGGFVMNTTHNIQSDIPTANLVAYFKAVCDARKLPFPVSGDC